MLILMGPNVKILMGKSFGSWTHGPGPWALAAAALLPHAAGSAAVVAAIPGPAAAGAAPSTGMPSLLPLLLP